MSREINFRGKDEFSISELDEKGIYHENGWVYGAYIDDYILTGIIEANDEYVTIESWVRVQPETVVQCTGVEDCHGEEVYDKDILDDGEKRWIVKWDKTMTGFYAQEDGGTTSYSLYHLCNGHNRKKKVYAIGNIHDNPELLK